MKTCVACGASVADAAKFCPSCGARLDEGPTDLGIVSQSHGAAAPDASADENSFYDTAINMIGRVAQFSIIRGSREEFLRSQFSSSPYLDQIIELGPQRVFSPEALRKKARGVINECTTKTAAVSFLSGLPSSPVTMVAAGGADVVQYFGFAIYLAQCLAYLFGEDELFDGGSKEMSDEAKIRVLAYLGVMFGAVGAAQLVKATSEVLGKTVGKRVAAQALTKTTWYPLLKKVGALVGQKVTKKTVEKTITKAVPVIGGVVSGALTFVTFRPMGERLADVFEQNLKGEAVTDGGLELSKDFLRSQHAESAGALRCAPSEPRVASSSSEADDSARGEVSQDA